jgi:RNA polymerase sigma-70 factor (ECF subfamily)
MAEDSDAELASKLTRTGVLDSTLHLIERARGGDQDALDRLIARHVTPLRRWARGRLPQWARDISDTEDLVQDALLQTFRRIDVLEVRGPGSLLAYLRQAVLNRVRDELRKKHRRPEANPLDEGDAARGRSPLEEAIGRESLERYELALARLSPLDREAIVGRVEMGYSYDELAEALGKSGAESARKATRRALIRLAEHLDLPDA